MNRSANWCGHWRAPKEEISESSLEDLAVCIAMLCTEKGIRLKCELEDILQDWVLDKYKEYKDKTK